MLPSLVRQCWKLVEAHAGQSGGGTDDIYNPHMQSPKLDALQQRFDAGSAGPRVQLAEELANVSNGPAIASALFLRYLSSLPGSFFGDEADAFEAAIGQPLRLSELVFGLSLERRTFLLHFISHIRTVVKHEMVAADQLLLTFATACRCSPDLLTAIYNNRRSILQPTCVGCEKIVALNDKPSYVDGLVTCAVCGSGGK